MVDINLTSCNHNSDDINNDNIINEISSTKTHNNHQHLKLPHQLKQRKNVKITGLFYHKCWQSLI